MRPASLARLAALALGLSWGGAALACPVCLGTTGPQRTIAQDIADSGVAVLAESTEEPRRFRVVTVLKGQVKPGDLVQVAVVDMPRVPLPQGVPILLGRHPLLNRWTPHAAVPAGHEDWLRRMATQKRLTDMGPDDWAARTRQFHPDLGSAYPLIRDTAIRELSRSPYGALLALKPVLDADRLAAMFESPDMAGHQPLMLLLLGISGAPVADQILTAALAMQKTEPRADLLPALFTALIERRGEQAVTELAERGLAGPEADPIPARALVAALGVHGSHPRPTLPRARIVTLYAAMIEAKPELAGAMVDDLEQWREFGLNARLAEIVRSDGLSEGARLIVTTFINNAAR